MLPNQTIYLSLPTSDMHLLLRSNIDVYSVSNDLKTTADYGWLSDGISSMEVKCKAKFRSFEGKFWFNSIQFMVSPSLRWLQRGEVSNLSATGVKLSNLSS